LAIAAFLFAAVELVILIDKLGQKRWFWPYDDSVFAGGILFGLVGAMFFRAVVAPIEQEYQERLEREDRES
jgi:hypothetical protein